MASASPSLVLLTGSNYLRAGAVGIDLDGGTDISIAMVVDLHVMGGAQDGTLASKHRPTSGNYGWTITFNATSGFITVTIYSDNIGTASISRVSTIALTRRSVIAFTFSIGSGTINIYINGVAANGAQTGAIATIATSGERLALGVDSTSGTPINIGKGAFCLFCMWRVVLTGGEVALILPDAVTPVSLLTGYNLVANFVASDITQTIDGHLNSWIDTIGSLTLTGFAASGDTPRANIAAGGIILRTNVWDSSLVDTGTPGLLSLSTTYAVLTPFRLWAAAQTEPQRASNFKQQLTDVTILCRARKVTGTTEAVYIRLRGLFLQYTLASKELFLIVGDDITGTNQNQRISFGFNIFPINGITADFVLRYNAVEDSADVFIGSTKYTGISAPTNANELTTGIFFSTGADWANASVVPACLNDVEVAKLISGNQTVAYAILYPIIDLGYSDFAYQLLDPDVPAYPAEIVSEAFPSLPSILYPLRYATRLFGYTNSPYPVIDSARAFFANPLPLITSVTVDVDHVITGLAVAGPTDAYETYSFWEIELDIGVSVIVIDATNSTQFFAGRPTVNTVWTVPPGSTWNGLRIRFVVQAVSDSEQIWFSPWVTLADANFDHLLTADLSIGVYDDPLSSIQAVSVDAMHNVTAVVMTGPITPKGSSATLHYWEIEMDTGDVFASGAMTVDGVISGTRVQIVDTFKVPVGELWNCRRIRFAVRIEDKDLRHDPTIFYSAWSRLIDPNFNNPGLPPQTYPVWAGAVNPVSDNPIIPPLAISLFDISEHTFKEHSVLFPVGSLINMSLTLDPTIGTPQLFNNGSDFPPGLYTVTYTAGARYNMTLDLWNDFFQGNFNTGSRGLWVKSGLNFPYYVMQAPAFLPIGYASQVAAEAAAIGYQFVFYHIGGSLGLQFDLDTCSYSGSITIALNDTQGLDIPGEWQIVDAPEGSNVLIVDRFQQYPTLQGLVRGQTHLRYIVRGLDKKPRWQETYVRVWPSPGAASTAQQLDPVAPKKPFPADLTGSAKLILQRNQLDPKPPTSGNQG